MRLTKHFTLTEMCKSFTAARHSIDNTTVDDIIISNLKSICINILEPVREHYDASFSPGSGYRCLELNRLLKSGDKSQHIKGCAVDFEVPGVSNYRLAEWCMNNLKYDQLIFEFGSKSNPSQGWVHASYVSGELNRQQILTINSYGVFEGLV